MEKRAIAQRNDIDALFFAVVDLLDRQWISNPNGFAKGDTVVSPVRSGLVFIPTESLGGGHSYTTGFQ
jgi:hypothetical protein